MWSQTQGPTATLSSTTSTSPTFDAPLINSTQAILTFSLTVNDGAVDSTTPDTVDITVSNVNTPPTANAGADQTVDEGTEEVTLEGSATDPDTDDTITYLWSQTQGPTATLSSTTSTSPTFDAPLINSTQAILTFSLTVNDGAVDSTTPDTVDITVSNVNTPPTANAGADQTVDEGTEEVTLEGSATDPDTDDTITYLWSQTQGPTATLSNSTSASPTFDAPLINSTQAILTFSLTVNDGAVDSTTPDTVDITVSNVNTPPTANAGADQTVDEGTEEVTLEGSATDPDTDDTITYLWSQTQGPTATLSSTTSTSPTFDAPLINSTQAILTFSLTVNDGAVDSTTPDTVDITVSNVNTPPTANAGADQTVDEGTEEVTLEGSATDPDTDDTITYLWSQTQGPTATLSSSTSASPTFDAPLINSTQAILTFSLTVNDGAVDSTTPDTVDITVSNVNTPPTANAGADQTVDEGTEEVTLEGSATDPDTDDTITYLWSQTQGPTATLSSSTSASPTFDAPLINSTQAILTFSLTVNDGAVDSTTPDTVDITVSNVNTPPTANAGADQTVDEGTEEVTLEGSATDPDTDDTITYLWSQTQGPTATLSSTTSTSPTFDAPLINSTQAILTFSLTVNDGAVDSTTPDTVDITVSNVNTPPTANAGADQTVDEGTEEVTLEGSATDPDTDDTITYLWSQTQGPTATLSSTTSTSPTFDAPLINSTQAILTFSLTVNDGAVDSTTPDTVDITVSNVNTPPTANAGADQTVDEGTEEVTLEGSATDPDTDDTITYLWSQTQGPTATLSSTTSTSPTFDAPLINSTQAILTFSLTVNDGAVDSTTPDTVDITVSNVNTPPTANAGADQTVDEGTEEVTLEGSATDPDTDDTITYLWSQTQGPTATLSSTTSTSPTFDAPLINSTQAILTFSLTVNDGAVDSTTPDTVDITVSNVNTPPTANAGADQTVDEGTEEVTLEGSATDPDTDDTITYLWSQTQGPTATLSNSTSASPTFDAPLINSTQAILTFSLTVNDGAVDSTTPDTVDITVSNVNTPPTANAGADQTVDEGTEEVTLEGSATDPDTDDTITYLWSQTQGPTATLSNSTSASPTFDAPLINSTQAILTFSLTVNDGAVDSTTPDTVDITVSNVNTPPTANAGADQTVDEGTEEVTLEGSATDPDTDDTITYLWSQTQGPTATLSSTTSTSPTFDAPLINSTQAILTFSLTVNDGAVDSTTPDTVDITVSNVNTPPTANAGADQTVDEGTEEVTLEGSATDPDTDDTITYLWSQTQGPTATLSNSTSASPTFDAPLINSTQAILTFSLTVNDGAVDSTTPDTVDITVSNVNTPPTANAGADQTVDEGTEEVTLEGSATDPDTDDTITYLWSQTQGPTATLSNSTSASPTFDAPLINSTQAILTFSLTVNDGAVDSTTPDTVDITVSNVNTPPTANAGADQTVDEGTEEVTLEGSATDPDTDDTITYLWSQTQGPTATLSNSTSASPTFDAPLINSTQAILTFSLTVNDGAVDSTTPDTVDITVSNVNTPPTANAGADQTVDEGTEEVTLEGSATDPDTDDTITYLWSQTQGPTATLSSTTSTSPTFDAPLINSTQAILTFSLTVNDGAVDSTTPDTVDITVSNVNTPPTANAGADQTVDEGTEEVTLEGSATDPDTDDTITYLWSQTQGPTATLSSTTSHPRRLTPP